MHFLGVDEVDDEPTQLRWVLDAVLRLAKDEAKESRLSGGLLVTGRGIPRAGCAVLDAEGTTIGEVTSGAPWPTLWHPIAMARIDRAFAAEGTELQVDLRGRGESFSVVPLPFYRRER